MQEAKRLVRPNRWKFRINERDNERVEEATNADNGDVMEVLSSLLNSQIIRHDFRSLSLTHGVWLNDDDSFFFFFFFLCITKNRNKNIVYLFNAFFFKKLTKS